MILVLKILDIKKKSKFINGGMNMSRIAALSVFLLISIAHLTGCAGNEDEPVNLYRSYAGLTDLGICIFAISSNEQPRKWDSTSASETYVAEAKSRGLTPTRCGEIILHSNRKESAVVQTNDNEIIPLQPITATPQATKSDNALPIYFGRYHALVIGNDSYRNLRPLRTARNDAVAVATLLRDHYGFRVTTLLDATRSNVLGTLAELRATLKPDDNLLIYYAGHGVVDSITEHGYWLPVDAENRNPTNWISNADLTNMLRAIRARHVMVVADSCYSGTLVRSASATLPTGRNQVAWIRRMIRKRTRTALVSGGLEPVRDGGGSGHSVFAKAFLAALRLNSGVLDGQALFDAIKRPVVLNSEQTPEYTDIRLAGHEGGEFIFVRRSAN